MKLEWDVKVIIILTVGFFILLAYVFYLRSDLSSYKTAVANYKSAQDTNMATIQTLSDRARELAAQNAIKESDAKAAAERNKRMFDALNEELQKRQTVREKVYVSDKSAAAWAAGVVPAAVSDSLR